MSGCRWRSNSPTPASRSSATTSTPAKVAAHQRWRELHPRRADAGGRRRRQGRHPARDHRPGGAGRRRRGGHLRADAAAQDQGPRPVLRGPGGRGHRQGAAQGSARHPGIDHLSRHHRRSAEAHARSRRPGGRRRFLPGVLARARRPGQSDLRHPQHPEGGGRRQRREHAGRAAPCTAPSSTPSCRSARPGSPRWSSCSRTPSGPSTSAWSTSWP